MANKTCPFTNKDCSKDCNCALYMGDRGKCSFKEIAESLYEMSKKSYSSR